MKHVETITLPYDLDEFYEIIDVRAPREFAEDHLPGAVNLPVLNDDERALENFRRVVELSPSAAALDSLARIHESRDEYAAAARWLAIC